MDFPHLKDTQFPIIDNVNVYKYQNNFDYARWNGKVSFKLLNVLWNSNYADVPYFNTDALRDEWFDSQEGYVGTLESLFNSTPENTIKIPIPYNDAYKYNYLVVDMPMQTSENNPINYEDKNIRIKRWFYFIEDMTQFAPSTTELQITIDYWTTFIHNVDIPYLMLERGHAPMTMVTPEQFLANPIMNNEYLLADDFNYGTQNIIKTSNYIPVGNGKKYVLFCAPYHRNYFDRFDGVKWNGNATPPTYSDTNERWGYQIQVNDYEWKYGKTDYRNADLPIYNAGQTGILNGCECFAIEGVYAQEFFNEMAAYHVNFIHGIQAMFILDESLFDKNQEFTFNGYTLYIADRKMNNLNLTLNKNQFGFDSKYADITKLYTFPYSVLEITDDDGNSFEARIENCGRIQMHTEVSLVYPFLNYNVFFSGINGSGTMQYEWEVVYGQKYNKTMWASDFAKFMMNWNVPTYSIYVSSENEYAVNNASGNEAKRLGAIKDYENAVRYANTTKENTADSYSTNTTNVAASGSTNTENVAASGNTNTANVAASGSTNTGNTQRTTSKNVTNTATTQAGLIDNMEDTNDANDYIIDELHNGGSFGSQAAAGNGYISRTAWANFEKVSDDSDTDWMVLEQGFGIQRDFQVGMGIMNVGSALAGGTIQTGGEGFGDGGGTVPIPIVGGITNAITTAASTSMVITNEQSMKQIQQDAINAKISHARTQTEKLHDAQKYLGYETKETNNNLRETITNRFSGVNGINNSNENRNKVCEDANAVDTQNTNNANAVRTQDTNNANAVRTQNTDNANAARTQNTETDNATYMRNANVVAEKANLVQKQRESEAIYKNSKLQAPVKYGDYSGDISQDVYMRRGVRLNVRTQSKSAIAQAGDAMLRFGYALHRVWDMSNGFHYGTHFTFWKAEDIWINDGNGVANAATNAIGQILMKGVTVWRNPSEIGTIGIYNNI